MIDTLSELDLNVYLDVNVAQINDALSTFLPVTGDYPRVQKAINHSLMAGGKRLRPILCLAAAETVGGKAKQVLPAACALEMIHTYSLIHDDLPAMDNDALRRGKPTCHIAFDEATAIMAGDALLTLAFEILSMASTPQMPAGLWLSAIEIISKAAGGTGMIQGQMQDMAFENRTISQPDLESMHQLKTGALIRASVQTGAVLCQASSRKIKLLTEYADHIGLAFQITDDILNVEGNPERMGKAAGTDTLRKKSTYPTLLGLEKSKSLAKRLVKNALHALDTFDKRAEQLRNIAKYIIKRSR